MRLIAEGPVVDAAPPDDKCPTAARAEAARAAVGGARWRSIARVHRSPPGRPPFPRMPSSSSSWPMQLTPPLCLRTLRLHLRRSSRTSRRRSRRRRPAMATSVSRAAHTCERGRRPTARHPYLTPRPPSTNLGRWRRERAGLGAAGGRARRDPDRGGAGPSLARRGQSVCCVPVALAIAAAAATDPAWSATTATTTAAAAGANRRLSSSSAWTRRRYVTRAAPAAASRRCRGLLGLSRARGQSDRAPSRPRPAVCYMCRRQAS